MKVIMPDRDRSAGGRGEPLSELPSSWARGPVHAIGGLFQVGFASGRDLFQNHQASV